MGPGGCSSTRGGESRFPVGGRLGGVAPRRGVPLVALVRLHAGVARALATLEGGGALRLDAALGTASRVVAGAALLEGLAVGDAVFDGAVHQADRVLVTQLALQHAAGVAQRAVDGRLGAASLPGRVRVALGLELLLHLLHGDAGVLAGVRPTPVSEERDVDLQGLPGDERDGLVRLRGIADDLDRLHRQLLELGGAVLLGRPLRAVVLVGQDGPFVVFPTGTASTTSYCYQ